MYLNKKTRSGDIESVLHHRELQILFGGSGEVGKDPFEREDQGTLSLCKSTQNNFRKRISDLATSLLATDLETGFIGVPSECH
jgi:hypothetical protein